MTVNDLSKPSDVKIKLRSGSSIVHIRPLFTRDSKCLILASGSDVKIYNIQSSECVHTLRKHSSRVIGLQESKSNTLQFFSCSADGMVVRWDHFEGMILQTYNLNKSPSCFYIPFSDHSWYCIMTPKNKDDFRLYSFKPGINQLKLILQNVIPKENAVAYGFEENFIVAIFKNDLTILRSKDEKKFRHFTAERNFTCVSTHPSDYIVATGDDYGRILIWSNLFNCRKVIKSLYHWHSLPVGDLFFSTEGAFLYSGGGESVLVKWNLFRDDKVVLPRLGAPICQLKVSPSNNYVAVGHNDNSLQVINSQLKVVQIIQGLTQGHFLGITGKNVIPTGLLYNPFLKAVVLNGKPGHLQFYNIQEDKQLFNLDISGRNIISSEKESVILNVDVQKAAFDDKGCLLATIEYWNDEQTSPQIWLKFWEYDTSKQTFSLNTNIILPHNKEINCVVFRPSGNVQDTPLAVTTSNDRKFKVWVLKPDPMFENKESWTCESMGCYRDLPAGDAAFSNDGSILAVAFGGCVTLWTIDSTVLKAVLCSDKNNDYVKQIVFGRESSSHLLICQNGVSITVWNVLSLSIEWVVHTELQRIAPDCFSDKFAAFCNDQTLVIFRPNNPEPIQVIENTNEKSIISAIFVPVGKTQSSQLFFFDADQNLMTLTDESEEVLDHQSTKILVNQNLPKTPFASLQAESRVSSVKAYEPELLLSTPVEGKFDVSYPTSMDPLVICSKVLKSLLIPLKKAEKEV